MTRRASLLLPALLLSAVLPGCDDNPNAPNAGITIVLPVSVTGTIVTCQTCTTEPTVWAVAETNITIINGSGRMLDVDTVEARAFNQTRNTLIRANTRPNVDHPYSETFVAISGSLTLAAGVVYFPLPPPGDDVRLVVVVTFRDGTSARGEARLITGA